MKRQLTVYMTIGIPGSGKTTWVRRNISKSIVIIALDELRGKEYGYFPQELDDEKERVIWNKALDIASGNLQRGKDVLIDSMALTKEFRKRIISDLECVTRTTFRKVAIFLDTPLEVALHRNNERSKRVLQATIMELSLVLEPPEAPEEFDGVITVFYKK